MFEEVQQLDQQITPLDTAAGSHRTCLFHHHMLCIHPCVHGVPAIMKDWYRLGLLRSVTVAGYVNNWKCRTEPQPPNLSFAQPYTTRRKRRRESAPAHMIHGSTVTYSSHSSKSSGTLVGYCCSIKSMASISACRVPLQLYAKQSVSSATAGLAGHCLT